MLAQALIFYLLFGCGVAVAVAIRHVRRSRLESLFDCAASLFFWPLYVPLLLQPVRADALPPEGYHGPTHSADDTLGSMIERTEAELDSALGSLDGWAEGALAAEHDRFAELRGAWRAQAERIRQLDRLLAQPGFAGEEATPPSEAIEPVAGESRSISPVFHSEQARAENIGKLRTLRGKLHDDLLGTLAWVRELVTMIHLAKYSGAPASRAQELVSQIAAAVEGLSEATECRQEFAALR